MKTANKIENKNIYIVVEVSQGVAVATYSFTHLKDAQRRLSQLRKERTLGEDDVQIFENTIN